MANKHKKSDSSQAHVPPVVAVLGHVDHGKTTLLDAIRKTSLAKREVGGITQGIGASSIELIHDGEKRKITFIDTPGHEAFSKMRGRGTQAADIGLLVISSVDGIMPQTKESISLLVQTQVPFIVVFTKADLPDKNIVKIKQQLLKEGITLEEFGGDTPVIEVSAKTGQNIHELLELILLVNDLKIPPHSKIDKPFTGIVIESRLDHTIGPVATVVIKSGSLGVGDVVYTQDSKCKVKSLITEKRERVRKVSVGDAIEVLGFDTVPAVGSVVSPTYSDKKDNAATETLKLAVPYSPTQQKDGILIILCADTAGSLEAIKHALPTGVKVITEKTGEITESDVLFAKSAGAIVIGFQVKMRNDILRLAINEKVLLKNYSLIYELLTELTDAVEGKKLAQEESIYGEAKVLAKFPYEKTLVLGIRVTGGRVARGDKARIIRGETIIGESTITSLRIGKQSTSKVEEGTEAGVILSPILDFAVGDMLLCHS